MTPDPDLPLLLGYLRNDLTASDSAQLEARLLTDDVLVRKLARLSVEESILSEWAAGVERIKQVDAADRNLGSRRVIATRWTATSSRRRETLPGRRQFWSSRGVLIAAAASVLIAAGIAFRFAPANNLPGGIPIAKVVAVHDAVWSTKLAAIKVGTGIPAGVKLELISGKAELEYVNGATVSLDGASTYELNSPLLAKLVKGKLTAYAPDTAPNFTVQTPSVEVVDKGTRFGVRANIDGTEVHVFEGVVETHSHDASDKKSSKQALSMLQACKFNSAKGTIEWVAPDYAGYGATKQPNGVLSTSSHVTWLEKPPVTLEEGKVVSDGKIVLIMERSGVVLPYDLVTTFFPSSGTRSAYNDNNIRMLPAGTRVDSYILHRESANGRILDGSVTFERPIVAIVARGKHLLISDKLLGLPGITYESKNTAMRGLDGGKNGSGPDVLQFSDNPNKISVRFESQPDDNMDEIRILVASGK